MNGDIKQGYMDAAEELARIFGDAVGGLELPLYIRTARLKNRNVARAKSTPATELGAGDAWHKVETYAMHVSRQPKYNQDAARVVKAAANVQQNGWWNKENEGLLSVVMRRSLTVALRAANTQTGWDHTSVAAALGVPEDMWGVFATLIADGHEIGDAYEYMLAVAD